jgi:hypothetical protein
MFASPPTFPKTPPLDHQYLDDEPAYDPALHLALEEPARAWTLDEFGYSREAIEACASNVMVTTPFRILSNEGVRLVQELLLELKSKKTVIAGNRVPSHLSGAVYRSRFLRDLAACPIVTEHVSKIAGTPLAPHSMPSQQMYVNYTPDDISKAVDSWHFDGIGFDYVLMVSDPRHLKGGKFEYFRGTKFEFADMFDMDVPTIRQGVTDELPPDRVVQAEFPAAGYAVFQQGNMIVHRAARIEEPAERTTMVTGYVALDMSRADPTAKHDLPYYAQSGVVAELARHSAWLAQSKLQNLIDSLPINDDFEGIEAAMVDAIEDVAHATRLLREARKNGMQRP